MRDILLTALIVGLLPLAVKRPFVGLLMWVWISLMSPGRLTWGFAYALPFAQMAALAMFLGLLLQAKNLYRFPLTPATAASLLLIMWLCISPVFRIEVDMQAREFELWARAIKVQVMVLITFLVVGTRDQLHKLVWVMTMSVAFYGVKGGVFVIATGGNYRVWGPAESFIGDNNHMALALVMTIPLMRYLQLQAKQRWEAAVYSLFGLLCFVSAIGSYSRGALLALAGMALFLLAKVRHKLRMAVFFAAFIPFVLIFMPDAWFERMMTIGTYEEDESAQGRLTAWRVAWNVAVDRFPIGGGFTVWSDRVFTEYLPSPEMARAAHSVYFQVLGEHGFGGLTLFLAVFTAAFLTGSSVIRQVRGRTDLAWAADMARMCQVSLIAFAVGGAFLSLSYFDFPYYVAAVMVVLHRIVTLGEPLPLLNNPARSPAQGAVVPGAPQ
jgi:putative inorganic carbon (hco3(-)) transporter